MSAAQSSRSGTSAFSSSGADFLRRQAATSSYQGYQGLYAKPNNPINPNQVTTDKPILNRSRTFNSWQDYSGYRDNYYSGRGWSAPAWSFGGHSSFGMWDAMFMWFMLSHLTSGAGFFYNHQNDPGVQAFRQEADKLALSNADLKNQVDALNAKLDELKKSGAPIDPTAAPAGVDANVAMARPEIHAQENAGQTLFWPVVGLICAGGVFYLLFMRKRV